MSGKFETIKHAENPEWWIWGKTRVMEFLCHPDIVDDIIESQTNLFAEQGYEVLDSYIERGEMFAKVKLLIRPKS